MRDIAKRTRSRELFYRTQRAKGLVNHCALPIVTVNCKLRKHESTQNCAHLAKVSSATAKRGRLDTIIDQVRHCVRNCNDITLAAISSECRHGTTKC